MSDSFPSPLSPGLYVHIPFCLSRCSYCGFASGIYNADQADLYLDAVHRELRIRGLVIPGFSPATLFIGGGTPSCLSPRQFSRLLAMLPFPAASGEATVEMNPDSADLDTLLRARDAGINRISVGVQTFHPLGLRLMRRRHNARQASEAVEHAFTAGFSRVSMDLITAWPGQMLADLQSDLKQAVALGVEHVSCYNILCDESEVFRKRMEELGVEEKDEAEVREFWDCTVELLNSAGFEQYEVSNFSRPGARCIHNVDVWKGKEYHGVGAAAHSHIGGKRWGNMSGTEAYIAAVMGGESPVDSVEALEPEGKARECAVFWLRLAEGIDTAEFAERTGFDIFSLYERELPNLLREGMLRKEESGGRVMLRVAPDRYMMLDSILVDLV